MSELDKRITLIRISREHGQQWALVMLLDGWRLDKIVMPRVNCDLVAILSIGSNRLCVASVMRKSSMGFFYKIIVTLVRFSLKNEWSLFVSHWGTNEFFVNVCSWTSDGSVVACRVTLRCLGWSRSYCDNLFRVIHNLHSRITQISTGLFVNTAPRV